MSDPKTEAIARALEIFRIVSRITDEVIESQNENRVKVEFAQILLEQINPEKVCFDCGDVCDSTEISCNTCYAKN